MNRTDLITQLLAAPAAIEQAELALHRAKWALAKERNAYADEEARLLIDGVDGKNAEQRQAQIHLALTDSAKRIRRAETDLMDEERAYNRAVNDARALRSVAALIAGAEEERLAA